MPYCPECGYELEGWEKFCPKCGSKISEKSRDMSREETGEEPEEEGQEETGGSLVERIETPGGEENEETDKDLSILRPIRFHFLIRLDDYLESGWREDKKKAILSWEKEIMEKCQIIPRFFDRADLSDYTTDDVPGDWKELKVVFGEPNGLVFDSSENDKESEIVSIYENHILESFVDFMKSSPKVEAKFCYFGLMERYQPPEPENMISGSTLSPVVSKAWEIIEDELEDFKSTEWFKKNYQQKDS